MRNWRPEFCLNSAPMSSAEKSPAKIRRGQPFGPGVGAAWATAWGGIALTDAGGPTYHGEMGPKTIILSSLGAAACFILLLGLAGCEDASRKPLQAPVPALAPAQAPAPAAPEVGALPLRNLTSQPLLSLHSP